MVEAVALGERAREPVLASARRCRAARARAWCPVPRELSIASSTCFARGEAQLDDHVREKARRGAAAGGPRDARPARPLRRRGRPRTLDLHGELGRRSGSISASVDRPSSARSSAASVAIDLDGVGLGSQRRSSSRRPMPKIACRSGPRPLRSSLIAPRPYRPSRDRCASRSAGAVALAAARRMTSSGAGRPVHSSKLSAPWATQDLQPVERARAVRARGGEQRGGSWSGRPGRRHTSTHRPDRTSARVG